MLQDLAQVKNPKTLPRSGSVQHLTPADAKPALLISPLDRKRIAWHTKHSGKITESEGGYSGLSG